MNILKADVQQLRYEVFESFINAFEQRCYDRTRRIIETSTKSNKLNQLERLDTLYKNHVKNYPKQNRQAILDNQVPEPIATNAAIAVNALCHQMYLFSL